MDTFNLVDKPWIPVLYLNGDFKIIGILKSFEDAHLIREIAASNPMDRVSIIRFLLAVLYWCKGNPEEGETLPDNFPMEWFKKLEDNKDCFNLLGDGKRFYQFGKEKFNSNTSDLISSHNLLTEIPHTVKRLFRKSNEPNEGLCLSCIALGLIRLPAFSRSGGRGYIAGYMTENMIFFVPVGENLLKTLELSYHKVVEMGEPIWIRDSYDISKAFRSKENKQTRVSLLGGLTGLPREIWLENPVNANVCVNCGSREPLVKNILFKGLPQTEKVNNETEKEKISDNWDDPFIWYKSKQKKDSIKSKSPIKDMHDTDHPWNDLAKKIINEKPCAKKYFVVGYVNDKANYIDIWERTINIFDDNDKDSVKEFIDKWDDTFKKIPDNIKDKKRKSKSLESKLCQIIRPQIENKASLFLKSKVEPWEIVNKEYQNFIPALSNALASGFTCNEVKRNKIINNTMPENIKKKIPAKKNEKGKSNE